MTHFKLAASLALTSAILVGCGGSDSDDSGTQTPTLSANAAEVLIDASSGAQAKMSLNTGAIENSDAWHVSYQKRVGFSVNGGLSGSGNVSGCIAHQYDALFNGSAPVQAEFEKLNQTNTIANFNAVTKDSCTDFEVDSLKTQIDMLDWVDYDFATHTVRGALLGNGFLIRHADGDTYSRLNVATLTGKVVTVKSELWDKNAGQYNPQITSVDLDFSTRIYYDLDTNAIVTASDAWDISIEAAGRSYNIQVNGGISGSGRGAVGYLSDSQNAYNVTDPTPSREPGRVYMYFADSAVGPMTTPGNYGALQYGVGGGHKMWPTFTTYLLKEETGASVFQYYKVQVISNLGKNEDLGSGNIVYRYEVLN
uniref:HmuY family protein n=1 Tax=Thaumasiovibrio occultus TaxID=1891184 RepID=UPI000B352B1B|nr:HmuY family protein [Thaumasiovibrio occultus]